MRELCSVGTRAARLKSAGTQLGADHVFFSSGARSTLRRSRGQKPSRPQPARTRRRAAAWRPPL